MQERAIQPETTDGELWQRAQAGDESAFAEIVERYGRQMVAFVAAQNGRRDGADDLTQELWLRVLRRGESFDGENLRAWLFRIARNLLIDARRRKRPEGWNDGLNPVAPQPPDEDERLSFLRECMEALQGDEFVSTLQLLYGGRSYREIATRLGVPTGTVGSRIARGKKMLRECVEGKMK